MKKIFEKILSFANTLAGDYNSREQRLTKKAAPVKSNIRQKGGAKSSFSDTTYGTGL